MSQITTGLFLTAKSLVRPTVFGVTGAILDGEGRVLLVRQTYMTGWRLPGGGLDHGEVPERALKRELHEELGLTGGAVRLFGLYSRKVWWLTHLTALYVIEGAVVNFRPNWEVKAVCWVPPSAPPQDIAPAAARRLRELAGHATPDGRW